MPFALDVVGIGALNLDYITTKAASADPSGPLLTERIATLLNSSGKVLELGTELNVDADAIYAAIEIANAANPKTALGGSAFNAIHAMAATRAGLRLGYVGIAGRSPVIGVSIMEHLDVLGVDRTFVAQDETMACGICFSLIEGGDRTLLTHVGANANMSSFLEKKFDDIVAYLSTARVVHVTSFLDDETAAHLLAVLSAVKNAGTGTLICFDPGHVWSVGHTPEVLGIIRASDYLLVNNREFQEIGHYRDGEANEEVAGRILGEFENPNAVVVVKRPTGIWCFHREREKVIGDFYGQTPLADDQIQDSTGAGDVFAAGLLTVLSADRLQVELGSLLGMALARHKLGYVGSTGHSQFAAVTRGFIRSLDSQRRSGTIPDGIFISHGRSATWRVVEDFVEKYFRLPVFAFESDPWGGLQVTEALTEYLERCSFAICVLTAEDDIGDGTRQGRQNVVHEIGLFQGRYGFDRVIVLAEESCAYIPPTPPRYLLTFPHDNVDHTFYRLGELLRSELLDDQAREN
ncbi:PfkB family carbohydrate kinase [Nocardia sp. NPDC058658]|uniref:PfkB family carbohydrate kinase n=1 Tax=Nocardia sp. NPDC058658 TaxID=3346580 RepID=UPI00364C3E50